MHSKYLILYILTFSAFILRLIESKQPNFVLFLTDDQDKLLTSMDPMKSTLLNIAHEGITFRDAYAHSPICCPSRSSLLTGKYLHNVRVFNNSLVGNCSSPEWQQEHEGKSIAAYLKRENNYVNFYAGKYLNQYGNKHSGGLGHVPEGYDWWYGLEGNSKYYKYSLSINGSKQFYSDNYLTDLMGTFAIEFLNNKPRDRPFFMTLATPAAHAPFTPADRHVDTLKDVTVKKTPSFNASAEGKHWLMQLPPAHLPENITRLDDIQRRRSQTLLSVDELVDLVIKQLKTLNVLDDTYIIFTSDNGYHIGQFGMPWDKRLPYETDVNVPLLIRGPNLPKNVNYLRPVSLVDLAPTILTWANVPVPEDMDGLSFADSLSESNEITPKIRSFVYVEYYGEGDPHSVQSECNFSEEDAQNLSQCSLNNWCKCQDSRNNTYTCVIDYKFITNSKRKFCSFPNNPVQAFEEFYDLNKDQFELKNTVRSLTFPTYLYYKLLLQGHRLCAGKTCKAYPD